MNIKEIGEFYKDFVMSEDFTEELQNKIRCIRDEQEYRAFISEHMLPKAAEKGYTFSVEDILRYEKIMLDSLSDEDLANVAGGRPDGTFVSALLLILLKR